MTAKSIEKLDLDMHELESILERAKAALSEDEHRKLKAAVETLGFLTQELESKDFSLKRLRGLLFGSQTEKLKNLLPEEAEKESANTENAATQAAGGDEGKKKRKGHGRNGAKKYVGAEKIEVPHESLKPGDGCPKTGCKGRVYSQPPAVIVRVRGQAPLQGKVFELERLRCNLCGEVFTAKAPEGVGEKKYDETSAAMIALLKYGSGLPFNRLARLEGNMGIPLPAATQWEIVAGAAREVEPAYGELVRQAAGGDVLHNDDTTAKILEFMGKRRARAAATEVAPVRTGIFTSGIVSVGGGKRIALFFTGRKHAGENLVAVLAKRAAELESPIQMCDALSRNMPSELKVIVANCLAHGRRQFVEVAENFPRGCRHVLETLAEVYRNDATARKEGLSPEERLRLHREHSRPLMVKLRLWFREQFKERRVEPNSGLGKAISYMKKHWRKLTLFYRRARAPLDNNIAERALKKAILHRRNSLFFKTQNGARVGDLFMSLIHTAELSGENPFDYLTELQRHSAALKKNPSEWMPWNYRETLARLILESS
jgi:hypothetical protein